MKKYIVLILAIMLLSSSFVAATSFAKAEGEELGYDWMLKVDKDLLKRMSSTKIVGDFDGDGDVDRYDFGVFACAYGTVEGDSNYDVECDLDMDGDVDRYDFGVFAVNYGKTC